MKKIVFIMIFLLPAIGCTSEVEMASSMAGEIAVRNAEAIAKGSDVTSENLFSHYTKYTLYAYDGSNAYIDGAEYIAQNSTFDTGHYWGGSSLDFWMYPTDQAFSTVAQWPDHTHISYDHPHNLDNTDAVDSQDLILSYTRQSPGRVVDVTYQHALASVKVTYGAVQAAHAITNVTLSGVNVSGECDFGKNQEPVWSGTVRGAYSQCMNAYVTCNETLVTSGEMVFFVIPGKGFSIDITLDDGRHVSKSFPNWELKAGACSHVLVNDDIIASSDATPKGICTKKDVSMCPDGTYSMSIEAYMTSKAVQVPCTAEKPVDFVIVTDVSGSMGDNMPGDLPGGASKKITALKSAICAFADTVAAHSARFNVEHRVSLVKFSAGVSSIVGDQLDWQGSNYSQVVNHFTTDMSIVKANANALTASGGTRVSNGMSLAESEFSTAREDAAKVCIVITDGGPGDYGWDYWNYFGTNSPGGAKYEAQNAVMIANRLKSQGVEVHSIGIFSGISTDSDEFMGRVSSNYLDATTFIRGSYTVAYSYEPVRATARQAYENRYYACDQGSYYVVSGKSGNKYYYEHWGRNYVTDADQFYMQVAHASTTGYGNGTKASTAYYLKAASADELLSAFGQVAADAFSKGSALRLDAESYLHDVVSNVFALPSNYGENPGDITLLSVAQAGYDPVSKEVSWSSTPVDVSSRLAWSVQQSSLNVKGWDYSSNHCGEGCTGTGHKLVVKLNHLTVRAGVSGKHYTNQYGSGLYSSSGSLVAPFDFPYVEL